MSKSMKRRLVIAVCAVLAVALLSFAVSSLNASADPANSNFEGVADGLPMGWINVSGNASMDYNESMSGTASLKLEGASSAVRQRYIPAVGGETYTITAQVKVDNENARPYIEATSYNGAMCLNATQSTGGTQTFTVGEWSELTLVYTAAPTATYIEILLSSGNNDATVWIDSVSISGAVSVADSTGNRIKNGDFSDGTTQWALNSNANGTVSYDASVGYGDTKSMKIVAINENPNLGSVFFSQNGIFVTPGKTYEISMYYKSDVANVRPQIRGYTYLGGGEEGTAITYMTAPTGAAANEWIEYTVQYTVPANVPAMRLIFTAIAPAGANIWFDEIYVGDIKETGSTVQTTNLVKNGGFEDGFDGWTKFKYGYYTLDTSKAYEGKQSLKLTQNTANSNIANVKQYVDIEAGKSYRLSAYFCTDNAEARPFFNCGWYNGDTLIGGTTFQVNATSGPSTWTELGANLTAPEGATRLYIEFNIRNVTANVWVDAISLVDGESINRFSVNVLQNPGFESGATNWRFYAQNENVVSTVDTTVSRSGQNSAKFQFNGTGRAYTQQKDIAVEPNTPYRISAWYRTENMNVAPQVIFYWNTSSDTNRGYDLTGVSNTPTWKRVVWESMTPSDCTTAIIYPNLTANEGAVWFDDLEISKIFVDTMSGNPVAFTDSGFEKGNDESPWQLKAINNGSVALFDTSVKNSGSQSVRLITETDDGEAKVSQLNIGIAGGMKYCLDFNYKTSDLVGIPYAKLMWYDANGNFISAIVKDLDASADWTKASLNGEAPANATKCAVVLGMAEGAGTVWFDTSALSTIILSAYNEPVYVSNVVNINESFYEPQDSNPDNDDPAKFWEMIPAVEFNEPQNVLWSELYFRKSYFGNVSGTSAGAYYTLPQTIENRDANTPRREGLLGVSTEGNPALVIATDIEFNPFMKDHGVYAGNYYPRRQHDYVDTQYAPSYVLTGDEYFKTRAVELLDFMKFSQWQADGSNEFTKKYYTNHSNADEAYILRPEWRGGWDYLFDWPWLDGYGYQWHYHEPDHHVNSQIVSTIVNAYEVFDLDESYLDMCREFVYYQIPRYGFHSGEWNGHTYYWTEYNPTGESQGNPFTDATDNIQALVSEAVAMVAYYEEDPILKARYLEYARGLMWYMVREFENDNFWFYDGGENPMNQRKSISHDSVHVYCSLGALTYLYKAGADVSDFLPYFEKFAVTYNLHNGTYQKKRFIEMAKVYDGTPVAGRNIKFTTFINVTSVDLEHARFSDTIPSYGFVKPSLLNVRISHILPPNAKTDNWTVDASQDVVYTVTPEQLEAGINIPFTLKYGEQYRVSYSLKTISGTFNRSLVSDTSSYITAWNIDENNNATFVKGGSNSSPAGGSNFIEPISKETPIDSDNFLSFAADLNFRFEREMASRFVDTATPTAKSYKDSDPWENMDADAYIYPISVAFYDAIKSVGGSTETQAPSGRILRYSAAGQTSTFNVYVPTDAGQYNVYTSYLKANNRGISQVYLDDVKQGSAYDLYAATPSSAPEVVENIPLGKATLSKGDHVLKYEVTGKNEESSGYEVGVYDTLILRPVK